MSQAKRSSYPIEATGKVRNGKQNVDEKWEWKREFARKGAWVEMT